MCIRLGSLGDNSTLYIRREVVVAAVDGGR